MDVAIAMIGVTIVAIALVLFAARTAVTVCVAEIERGKIRVVRGGIAERLLADLADVVARPPVARATIRIVRSRGRAELEMAGDLSEAQRQQVRNVVGSVPLAMLANTRRPR